MSHATFLPCLFCHSLCTVSWLHRIDRCPFMLSSRHFFSIHCPKFLHSTCHTFTNCLRTHLKNLTNFFVGKTTAIMKLQNGRILRLHHGESLLYKQAGLGLVF